MCPIIIIHCVAEPLLRYIFYFPCFSSASNMMKHRTTWQSARWCCDYSANDTMEYLTQYMFQHRRWICVVFSLSFHFIIYFLFSSSSSSHRHSHSNVIIDIFIYLYWQYLPGRSSFQNRNAKIPPVRNVNKRWEDEEKKRWEAKTKKNKGQIENPVFLWCCYLFKMLTIA